MSWPMCYPCLGHLCYLCLGTAQEPRPTKLGPFAALLAISYSAMRAALPRPPTVNDMDLSRGKRGLIRC